MDRLIDEMELQKERVDRSGIGLPGAGSELELEVLNFRIVAKERGYVLRFSGRHGRVSSDERDDAVSLGQHRSKPEVRHQVAHSGAREKSYMRSLCRGHC